MANLRPFFLKKLRTLTFIILAGAGVISSGCTTGGGDVLYYVSLGDSLSVGTQPDANGENMTTDNGYPDVLYQLLLAQFPNLQLVKLGCLFDPGETTVTMVDGGSCDYPGGASQLDAAREFILANQDKILLVTIDIGVNDLLQSGCIDTGPPLMVDAACVQNFLENILPPRLSFVMNELFQMTTPAGIPVIGLNYYNPFVVVYFTVYQVVAEGIKEGILADPEIMTPIVGGCFAACMVPFQPPPFPPCVDACVTAEVTPIIAQAVLDKAPQETVDIVVDLGIDDLAQAFNFLVIQGVYDLVGFPVADIYSAFMAGDFTLAPIPVPPSPVLVEAPINAQKACALSFMCAPDPVGPNIHSTDAGYQVMGQTVFDLFNSL